MKKTKFRICGVRKFGNSEIRKFGNSEIRKFGNSVFCILYFVLVLNKELYL